MNATLPLVTLGRSELRVRPICLGTMTFGEQVDETAAHAILDRALERGVNFIDTAEVYAVPVRRETYGESERIVGRWFATRPGARDKVVLATKVAGPARHADCIVGANTVAQLDENLDAWGTALAPELLAEIDRIRWVIRDPAQ